MFHSIICYRARSTRSNAVVSSKQLPRHCLGAEGWSNKWAVNLPLFRYVGQWSLKRLSRRLTVYCVWATDTVFGWSNRKSCSFKGVQLRNFSRVLYSIVRICGSSGVVCSVNYHALPNREQTIFRLNSFCITNEVQDNFPWILLPNCSNIIEFKKYKIHILSYMTSYFW